VLLASLSTGSAAAQSVPSCGELTSSYGPYDYRTNRDMLPIVERHHFPVSVETLVKGVSGPVGAELNYVLTTFPNHHRALLAMTRLSERQRWQIPNGARYDIDCYYERALRFRPNDVVARLLYVAYLAKRNRRKDALAQLAAATGYAADNGFSHYNVGMQYLELGEHAKALDQAHRAQALGFEGTELRNRLKAAGRWSEPPAPAASAAQPASAASR
jgi:hypothetical protein